MAYQFPLNGGRINATVGGNSTSAGAGYKLISTGTMMLAGGNNITLSQNGASITISGASAANASINFSASNTSANLASVTFSNSNGVSFGLTNGTLTASHNGLTSQSAQTQSNIQGIIASGSTNRTGDISFANSNGITFGLSNNTVTASVVAGGGGIAFSNSQTSYSSGTVQLLEAANAAITIASTTGSKFNISVPAQSNLSATGAVSMSSNGGTISIGAPYFLGGISNLGNTSGTSSTVASQTRMVFAGGNNITLSQATGAGANTITVSGAPMFDAGVSNTVAGGSTFGTMGTANTGGLILYAGSNIGLSQSANAGGNASVTIQAAGGGAGGGVALSAGGALYSSGTLNISNAGGALTMSTTPASVLNFSVPGTSSLVGTNNITVATAGNNISISGADMFAGGMMGSAAGGTSGGTSGSNSGGLFLYAGSNINLSQSTNTNGASVTISSPDAGAGGGGATLSRWDYPNQVFGSLGAGVVGSLSIQHMYIPFNVTGQSMKVAGSINVSTFNLASTASANISLHLGIYTLNGSTLARVSSGSANNAITWLRSASSSQFSSITGLRQLTAPMNINATPGEYWVAALHLTATTATAMAPITFFGDNQINATGVLGVIGSQTSAGRDVMLGQGIYSTTTNAMPASITLNQINNYSASYAMMAAFYNAIYNATY